MTGVAAHTVVEVGCDEDADVPRHIAEDVVGTTAQDDARGLALGNVADDVALHLEEGIAREGAPGACGCTMPRGRTAAEEERAERARHLLVGLLEELTVEAALLGCKLDEFLVIDVDAVVPGNNPAGGTSAAA